MPLSPVLLNGVTFFSHRIHPDTRGDDQKIEKHGQLKLLRNALNLVVIKVNSWVFVLIGC